MAISACKVLSALGLDRLNQQIAVAVADGFAPHGDLLPVANGEFVLIMVKRDAGIEGCKVIEAAGLVRLNDKLASEVLAGFVPHSDILTLADSFAVVLVKGDTGSGGGGTVTVDGITDASTVGKSVLKAADAATARTAIGAGTSNLAIGTTATTAKAGNYAPTWTEVTGKPAVIGAGADQAAARAAIGAGIGNSNLVVGTTATQAKAGNWLPAMTDITGSGAFGRQLLGCADQASAKTLLGIA